MANATREAEMGSMDKLDRFRWLKITLPARAHKVQAIDGGYKYTLLF